MISTNSIKQTRQQLKRHHESSVSAMGENTNSSRLPQFSSIRSSQFSISVEEEESILPGLVVVLMIIIAGTSFVTVTGLVTKHIVTSDQNIPEADNSSFNNMSYVPSFHPISSIAPTNYPTKAPDINGFELVPLGEPIAGMAKGDWLGYSISISSEGKRIAIGSYNHDDEYRGTNSGLVQVYEIQDGIWTQIGSNIPGKGSGDRMGFKVSLSYDGIWLAVSASDGYDGYIHVYQYTKESWVKRGQELTGYSVALSQDGSRVAVGGNGYSQLYEYHMFDDKWIQLGGNITEVHYSFVSTSKHGDFIAIGSPNDDEIGNNNGRVRVFKYNRNINIFSQMGQTLYGKHEGDGFGKSLSLSQDGMVLSIGTASSNHVRVFHFVDDIKKWEQLGSDLYGGKNHFGWSLSLSQDGEQIVIGSPWYNGSRGRAVMYRFESSEKMWYKVIEDLNGLNVNDYEGWDVAISPEGRYMASSARKADQNGLEANGRVSIFQLSPK